MEETSRYLTCKRSNPHPSFWTRSTETTPTKPRLLLTTTADRVSASLQHEALSGLPDSERMRKYKNLTAAISSGNDEEARELGKAFGWELDALKVSSAGAITG